MNSDFTVRAASQASAQEAEAGNDAAREMPETHAPSTNLLQSRAPTAHEAASDSPLTPLEGGIIEATLPHEHKQAKIAPRLGDDLHELLLQLTQNATAQSEKLEALRSWCESYVGSNQSKDETIGRMQKRLEEYERGMLRSLKEPMLRDLMLLYDSLDKLLSKSKNGVLATAEFARELELLRAELLEVFSTQNMEPITIAGEPRYQPELQKVVQIESAENAEENQLITRVVREGFVWEGRVLRKQEVAVKKWAAQAAEKSV